jgi:hypothetical protein
MSLQCWKCGASLAGVLMPLGRREICPSCHAELHVCRMCRHYDARRAGQCRELAADQVSDKTRANFCGWFVPRPDAYQGGGAAMAQTPAAAPLMRCSAGSAGRGESTRRGRRLVDLFKK